MWKNIKKSYKVLLLSVFVIQSSFALKIKGRVLSLDDNKPLYGANVMIEGTEFGTATDENGCYSLDVKEVNSGELSVSYIGYFKVKKEFNAHAEQWLEIKLKPNPLFQLGEVVVTGTRSERLVEDVPVLIETLHSDEMISNGNSTVKDALEEVALFDFAPDNHGDNITMRGLGPKYVLFLVDGERISGEVKGNINFSKLNINNVDRIEILKGASSSLYGSNAIGGVVNIISRNINDPLELNLFSKLSEYNTMEYSGLAGVRLGKFSSSTSALYKSSDGYDLSPETTSRTVEKYNYFTINQKLNYKVGDKLRVNGGISFFRQDKLKANRTIVYKYPRNYDLTYNLAGDYRFNDKNNLRLSWNSDNYDSKYVFEKKNDKEVKDYSHTADAARIVTENIIYEKHAVTTGVEYLKEKIYSTRVYDTRHSTEDYILFMQDDFSIGEKWAMIAGFRMNNHSTYGNHFNPNVNLMYKVDNLNIRAAYGKGFKTPSLKELYLDWDHGGSGPFVYGNEDLKPENSNHYSLSMEYHQLLYNGVVTIYRNDIENMIDSQLDPGSPNVYYYQNVDDAMTQGIELMFNRTIFENFQISGGYTFIDTEDESTGEQLLGRAQHQGNIGLKYVTSKWLVNFRGKFIGEKDWGEDEDDESGETIKYIQSSHAIWKLSCNRELFSRLNLGFGIDNIFDYTDKDYLTTPGRIIYGTINIKY